MSIRLVFHLLQDSINMWTRNYFHSLAFSTWMSSPWQLRLWAQPSCTCILHYSLALCSSRGASHEIEAWMQPRWQHSSRYLVSERKKKGLERALQVEMLLWHGTIHGNGRNNFRAACDTYMKIQQMKVDELLHEPKNLIAMWWDPQSIGTFIKGINFCVITRFLCAVVKLRMKTW